MCMLAAHLLLCNMLSCFVLVEKEYTDPHSQRSEEDSTSQVNVIKN